MWGGIAGAWLCLSSSLPTPPSFLQVPPKVALEPRPGAGLDPALLSLPSLTPAHRESALG